MKPNVLIISHQEDAHADAVEKQLYALDAYPLRLNTELLGSDAGLTIFWDSGSSPATCYIQLPGKGQVDTAGIYSVWYRRPKPPALDRFTLSKSDLDFARDQWENTLAGLLALLSEALWVSPPGRITAGSRKPFQLNLARRLGFSVPATLITNDPNVARDFYNGMDGQVVVKPSGRGWTTRGETGSGGAEGFIYTNRLEPQHLEHFDEVAIAPMILQELVAKAYEIRVWVVGRRVLAVKIESQASDRSALDWRRYDVERTPYSAYTVPPELEKRCIQLTKMLGLQYGALDFIRTPEGIYTFLEINCNGQFLWAEVLSGVPISAALARLLAGLDPAL